MTQENQDAFKEACYDMNSIDELIKGLARMSADKTDMKTWNITATEWRNALSGALCGRIEDLRAEMPE